MKGSALELIRCAQRGVLPAQLPARVDVIAMESDWYQQAIRLSQQPIYGATTLTGHRDSVQLPYQAAAALQQAIVDSHCIGTEPYFSPFAARLIGYAKAYASAAGGSGISRELYLHLLETLADESFQPSIPMAASYSCGDVIPGAHWARGLLGHRSFSAGYRLAPGDALALINGSFVDVGSSLALIPPMQRALTLCAINSKSIAAGCNQTSGGPPPGPTAVRDLLAFVSERATGSDATSPQAAVSIRATPQILGAILATFSTLVAILDDELSTPSANPYVDVRAQRIVSQASFMSPRLAIAKSAASEAVLFAAWACQSRISAISSLVEQRLPQDQTLLNLIQVPKLTQAMLEDCRLRAGRRLFASGSDTSLGTEDLWSFGVFASAQLGEAMAAWQRMETILYRVLQMLQSDTQDGHAGTLRMLHTEPGSPWSDEHLAWQQRIDTLVTAALQ